MNGASLLQTGLALALVIGMVLVLGALVQRLVGRRRRPGLSVVSQVSLGQRERVVVVAWDGQEWMLGVGPGQVNLMAHRDAPPPAETAALTPALSQGERGREAARFTPSHRSQSANASHPLPLGEGRGEGAVLRSSPTFPQAFAQQLQQTLARWSAR